jgi:hypothetical protein
MIVATIATIKICNVFPFRHIVLMFLRFRSAKGGNHQVTWTFDLDLTIRHDEQAVSQSDHALAMRNQDHGAACSLESLDGLR